MKKPLIVNDEPDKLNLALGLSTIKGDDGELPVSVVCNIHYPTYSERISVDKGSRSESAIEVVKMQTDNVTLPCGETSNVTDVVSRRMFVNPILFIDEQNGEQEKIAMEGIPGEINEDGLEEVDAYPPQPDIIKVGSLEEAEEKNRLKTALSAIKEILDEL